MLAKVEIRNISAKTTEVIVDGRDISDKISGLTYQHCAGETPKLILEMVPGTMDIVSNGCRIEKEP
ncbi:hypothetical protein AALA54_17215 [Oscillospiraceae bacterium 44-34]